MLANTYVRRLPWLLVLVPLVCAAPGALAQSESAPSGLTLLKRVDVATANQAVSVRVFGDGPLAIHAERLNAPDRLVLDFANARLSDVHPRAGGAGPVRGIRVGQFKPDVARVVVDLNSAAPYRIESGEGSVTIVFGTGDASAAQHPAAPPQLPLPPGNNAQPRISSATLPIGPRGEREKVLSAVSKTPRQGTASIPPASVSERVLPATTPTPPPASAAAAIDTVNDAPNSFQNGLLTFHAKDQPLRSVLDEIGAIANVAIMVGDGVGNEQVSVEFRAYRLDEALRQTLKAYDVLFSYGGGNDAQGNLGLRTVWVYAPNQGPAIARVAMTAWNASTKQYEQTLANPDPDERARAVDELIRRDGRDASSVVAEALKDPSDKVRYQALYRAMLVGALPPEDTIIDLVLNDPSEGVRLWAFQTLPLDPTLRWVALRLSTDPNEQMADLARKYLSDLDGSSTGPLAAPQVPQMPLAPVPQRGERPPMPHPAP